MSGGGGSCPASSGEVVPVPRPDRLNPSHPHYGDILAAHQTAVAAGQPGYLDPGTGLFVLTAVALAERGSCCGCGCRHCPFPLVPAPESTPGP